MSEFGLKPCPFCFDGKSSKRTVLVIQFQPDVFSVMCYECGLSTDNYGSSTEAKNAWNTRPIEDALNKRIAELEAVIDTAVVHMRRLLPEYDGIDVDSLSHDRYAKAREFIAELAKVKDEQKR